MYHENSTNYNCEKNQQNTLQIKDAQYRDVQMGHVQSSCMQSEAAHIESAQAENGSGIRPDIRANTETPYTAVPALLREKKNWVCYRLEPDPKSDKPKKTPVNACTGRPAQSNNPATWTDFETACRSREQYGYTGIGFVFEKDGGLVGVDIDHCYDPETGSFNETAKAILSRQKTYAEFSPSGDGVHLWFRGEKPKGGCRSAATGVEMYDSVRYFTVTGKRLPEAEVEIAEAKTGTLEWIMDNFISRKKTGKEEKGKAAGDSCGKALSDDEILKKALAASNSSHFSDLWYGNWQGRYGSQSEADLALCSALAFWSGNDPVTIDRLFRRSGLFRSKWDEHHHSNGSTYGQHTVAMAVEGNRAVYFADKGSHVLEYGGLISLQKGDSITSLTNFEFRPGEMIIGEDETQLTADFVTEDGTVYPMTFLTADFSNLSKFKTLLNRRTIDLSFFGSESDLEQYKTYVSGLEWTKKTGKKAVGIYRENGQNLYVSPDGALSMDGKTDGSLVQMESFQVIRSGILDCSPLTADQLAALGKEILSYNEPQKTVPILAWTAACFLKPLLRISNIKFPHLFLIGEAGSGKSTTLEQIILRIFSMDKVTAASQVTRFTLMRETASSNLFPMVLDEFKPSKMSQSTTDALCNHFRQDYDCQQGTRGKPDQTVEVYDLLAPLLVAGEENAEETAIRERTIELLFSKKDTKAPDRTAAFDFLVRNPQLLSSLGRSLLNTALYCSPEEVKSWYEEGRRHFSSELPSRIVSNLSCLYAGLMLVLAVCTATDIDHAWEDFFPYTFDQCVAYLEAAAIEYNLDGGTHNLSVVEEALEVIARMPLSPNRDYCLTKDRKLLYLPVNDIYDIYTKYRRECAIVGEVLPLPQFRKQLKSCDFVVEISKIKNFNGTSKRCVVINYEILSARCDVSGFIADGRWQTGQDEVS